MNAGRQQLKGEKHLVVDAILLAASDTKLHFKQHIELRHLLEVAATPREI